MAYDFAQFKKDVKRTSEKVSEKAKEFTDTTKLKVDIKTKERELDKLYCALGKVYFAAHQNDDEETLPEAVMFRGIKRAEAELAQLNKELAGDDEPVEASAAEAVAEEAVTAEAEADIAKTNAEEVVTAEADVAGAADGEEADVAGAADAEKADVDTAE